MSGLETLRALREDASKAWFVAQDMVGRHNPVTLMLRGRLDAYNAALEAVGQDYGDPDDAVPLDDDAAVETEEGEPVEDPEALGAAVAADLAASAEAARRVVAEAPAIAHRHQPAGFLDATGEDPVYATRAEIRAWANGPGGMDIAAYGPMGNPMLDRINQRRRELGLPDFIKREDPL